MAVSSYRRWPKGTYMILRSPESLRTFVGPEPEKRITGRRLAKAIHKHPSFIDHLLAGRSKTCLPETAQSISEVLGLPLVVLFDPKVPSAAGETAKTRKQTTTRKVAA